MFVFSRRECEKHVKNFQGARFKKFSTNEEAENFVRGSDTGYNNNNSCTAFNVSVIEKPRKTVVYYDSTKLAKNKGLVICHIGSLSGRNGDVYCHVLECMTVTW